MIVGSVNEEGYGHGQLHIGNYEDRITVKVDE